MFSIQERVAQYLEPRLSIFVVLGKRLLDADHAYDISPGFSE